MYYESDVFGTGLLTNPFLENAIQNLPPFRHPYIREAYSISLL